MTAVMNPHYRTLVERDLLASSDRPGSMSCRVILDAIEAASDVHLGTYVSMMSTAMHSRGLCVPATTMWRENPGRVDIYTLVESLLIPGALLDGVGTLEAMVHPYPDNLNVALYYEVPARYGYTRAIVRFGEPNLGAEDYPEEYDAHTTHELYVFGTLVDAALEHVFTSHKEN